MGDGDDTAGTALVVVTTEAATTVELSGWLSQQLGSETLTVRRGFYDAMMAIARRFTVIVADVGDPVDRHLWRLAEIRTQAPDATVVVVADAAVLPHLAGPLRPDLAVRSVADLPPLRELLMTGTTPVVDQTMRRRSRR